MILDYSLGKTDLLVKECVDGSYSINFIRMEDQTIFLQQLKFKLQQMTEDPQFSTAKDQLSEIIIEIDTYLAEYSEQMRAHEIAQVVLRILELLLKFFGQSDF